MDSTEKRIRDLERELLSLKSGLATSGRAFVDTKIRTISVQGGILALHFPRPDFPLLYETEGFGSVRLDRYRWRVYGETDVIIMSEQDFTWTQ